MIIFSKNSCKKCGYLDKKQKETIMTYRQESEKDEEHALIPKCAKQMKHSQESETDEEQTLIYLNTDVSRA